MSVSLAAEKTGKVAPHIIVLRNGRVLAGQVTLIEAGYQVDSLSGRVVIPRNLVEVEALNLVDAHRKLRSKMPGQSASSHVALGRWCLAHGLNQQALAEFRAAERLAPKNKKSATKEVIAQLAPKVAASSLSIRRRQLHGDWSTSTPRPVRFRQRSWPECQECPRGIDP